MSLYTRYNALFISICLLLHQAHGNVPAPAHSPEAHTDLICHTSHASECYPAIFQPTEDFQRIHDDQSIPPGLHVRLNLATGLKEARLNVPEADDAPKADLVLIDNQAPPTAEEQAPVIPDTPSREQSPLQSSSKDNPKTPSPFLPSEDTDKFLYYQQNAAYLFDPLTNTDTVHAYWTELTEYAHSQEWGQAITSDSNLAHTFVRLIDPESLTPIEIQSASAQLLGTAIQNNPEALKALLAHFAGSNPPTMKPMHTISVALERSTATKPTIEINVLQKRLLFLLSQLCHDSTEHQLHIFLSEDGLSILQRVFAAESAEADDGGDKVRTKVANFMVDLVIPSWATWHERLRYKDTSIIKSSEDDSEEHIQVAHLDVLVEEKAWCEAFETALEKYAPGLHSHSNQALETYQSIVEAHDLLDQVLAANGCEGGCKCDFSARQEELSAPEPKEL